MRQITYAFKEQINNNPDIPAKNKCRAVDLNEIKTQHNALDYDLLYLATAIGVGTDTWSGSASYDIGDIVCYNYKLYENITGTNTQTSPANDSTNWQPISILVN